MRSPIEKAKSFDISGEQLARAGAGKGRRLEGAAVASAPFSAQVSDLGGQVKAAATGGRDGRRAAASNEREEAIVGAQLVERDACRLRRSNKHG